MAAFGLFGRSLTTALFLVSVLSPGRGLPIEEPDLEVTDNVVLGVTMADDMYLYSSAQSNEFTKVDLDVEAALLHGALPNEGAELWPGPFLFLQTRGHMLIGSKNIYRYDYNEGKYIDHFHHLGDMSGNYFDLRQDTNDPNVLWTLHHGSNTVVKCTGILDGADRLDPPTPSCVTWLDYGNDETAGKGSLHCTGGSFCQNGGCTGGYSVPGPAGTDHVFVVMRRGEADQRACIHKCTGATQDSATACTLFWPQDGDFKVFDAQGAEMMPPAEDGSQGHTLLLSGRSSMMDVFGRVARIDADTGTLLKETWANRGGKHADFWIPMGITMSLDQKRVYIGEFLHGPAVSFDAKTGNPQGRIGRLTSVTDAQYISVRPGASTATSTVTVDRTEVVAGQDTLTVTVEARDSTNTEMSDPAKFWVELHGMVSLCGGSEERDLVEQAATEPVPGTNRHEAKFPYLYTLGSYEVRVFFFHPKTAEMKQTRKAHDEDSGKLEITVVASSVRTAMRVEMAHRDGIRTEIRSELVAGTRDEVDFEIRDAFSNVVGISSELLENVTMFIDGPLYLAESDEGRKKAEAQLSYNNITNVITAIYGNLTLTGSYIAVVDLEGVRIHTQKLNVVPSEASAGTTVLNAKPDNGEYRVGRGSAFHMDVYDQYDNRVRTVLKGDFTANMTHVALSGESVVTPLEIEADADVYGRFMVSIDELERGNYSIEIKFKGLSIKGSPAAFKPKFEPKLEDIQAPINIIKETNEGEPHDEQLYQIRLSSPPAHDVEVFIDFVEPEGLIRAIRNDTIVPLSDAVALLTKENGTEYENIWLTAAKRDFVYHPDQEVKVYFRTRSNDADFNNLAEGSKWSLKDNDVARISLVNPSASVYKSGLREGDEMSYELRLASRPTKAVKISARANLELCPSCDVTVSPAAVELPENSTANWRDFKFKFAVKSTRDFHQGTGGGQLVISHEAVSDDPNFDSINNTRVEFVLQKNSENNLRFSIRDQDRAGVQMSQNGGDMGFNSVREGVSELQRSVKYNMRLTSAPLQGTSISVEPRVLTEDGKVAHDVQLMSEDIEFDSLSWSGDREFELRLNRLDDSVYQPKATYTVSHVCTVAGAGPWCRSGTDRFVDSSRYMCLNRTCDLASCKANRNTSTCCPEAIEERQTMCERLDDVDCIVNTTFDISYLHKCNSDSSLSSFSLLVEDDDQPALDFQGLIEGMLEVPELNEGGTPYTIALLTEPTSVVQIKVRWLEEPDIPQRDGTKAKCYFEPSHLNFTHEDWRDQKAVMLHYDVDNIDEYNVTAFDGVLTHDIITDDPHYKKSAVEIRGLSESSGQIRVRFQDKDKAAAWIEFKRGEMISAGDGDVAKAQNMKLKEGQSLSYFIQLGSRPSYGEVAIQVAYELSAEQVDLGVTIDVKPEVVKFSSDDLEKWNEPKQVQITFNTDSVVTGNFDLRLRHSILSSDSKEYSSTTGLPTQTLTIACEDADGTGISFLKEGKDLTKERNLKLQDGETFKYSVKLRSKPSSGRLEIQPNIIFEGRESSNLELLPNITIDPKKLVFDNATWNEERFFTIEYPRDYVKTATFEELVVKHEITTTSIEYENHDDFELRLECDDTDEAKFVFTLPGESNLKLSEGESYQYSVKLESKPSSGLLEIEPNVKFYEPEDSDLTLPIIDIEPKKLVFDADSWEEPRFFTLTYPTDNIKTRSFEALHVKHEVRTTSEEYKTHDERELSFDCDDTDEAVIEFKDTQGKVLKDDMMLPEGEKFQYNIRLKSKPSNGSLEIELALRLLSGQAEHAKVTIEPSILIFAQDQNTNGSSDVQWWAQQRPITIHFHTDDVDTGNFAMDLSHVVRTESPEYRSYMDTDRTLTCQDKDTANIAFKYSQGKDLTKARDLKLKEGERFEYLVSLQSKPSSGSLEVRPSLHLEGNASRVNVTIEPKLVVFREADLSEKWWEEERFFVVNYIEDGVDTEDFDLTIDHAIISDAKKYQEDPQPFVLDCSNADNAGINVVLGVGEELEKFKFTLEQSYTWEYSIVGARTNYLSLSLNSKPTHPVSVTLNMGDVAPLAIKPAKFELTTEVVQIEIAVDVDKEQEGGTYVISFDVSTEDQTYNDINIPTVQVDYNVNKAFPLIEVILGIFFGIGSLIGSFHWYQNMKERQHQQEMERVEKNQQNQLDEIKKNLVRLSDEQTALLREAVEDDRMQQLEFKWGFERSHLERKKIIGNGSFGQVWSGELRGLPCAIKSIVPEKVNQVNIEKFCEEVDLMSGLGHPNVVRMLGCLLKPPEFCLVMELAARGSLGAVLELNTVELKGKELPLTWSFPLLGIAIDAVRGMSFCHARKPSPLLHRDLKPDNILVTANFTAQIADFGIARHKADETMTTARVRAYDSVRALRLTNTGLSRGNRLGRRFTALPKCSVENVMARQLMCTLSECKGIPGGDLSGYYRDQIEEQIDNIKSKFGPSLGVRSPIMMLAAVGWRPNMPPALLMAMPGICEVIEKCWANDPESRPTFAGLLKDLMVLKSKLPTKTDDNERRRESSAAFARSSVKEWSRAIKTGSLASKIRASFIRTSTSEVHPQGRGSGASITHNRNSHPKSRGSGHRSGSIETVKEMGTAEEEDFAENNTGFTGSNSSTTQPSAEAPTGKTGGLNGENAVISEGDELKESRNEGALDMKALTPELHQPIVEESNEDILKTSEPQDVVPE